MAAKNFSEDDVNYMKDRYGEAKNQEERSLAVDEIAKKLGKTPSSIRSKLVKEKIYISAVRTSKVTKGKPETKESMVGRIEETLDMESGSLVGLEKAPKLVLLNLLDNI